MGQPAGLSYDRLPWTWILVAAGALFYIPFIGGVALFDWDEINFAEISREMMMTGDYLNIQVNYKAFFEKPPFFFWLQVLSTFLYELRKSNDERFSRTKNALCQTLSLKSRDRIFIRANHKVLTYWNAVAKCFLMKKMDPVSGWSAP